LVEAAEAAIALGDHAQVEELLTGVESLPPGQRPRYLDAHASRLRARLSHGDADAQFRAAAARFRELGTPFWLAVTLVEWGERLVAESRPTEADPLLSEAHEIFERLRARPWLGRLDRTVEPEAVAAG
jgi:hypothetical protein